MQHLEIEYSLYESLRCTYTVCWKEILNCCFVAAVDRTVTPPVDFFSEVSERKFRMLHFMTSNTNTFLIGHA